MAYLVKSALQTFFGDSGQLLAGGSLKFYAADTVTPKAVYADKALTTTNGSTVALDASGRPLESCWGAGDYFIEVYNSASVKMGEEAVSDAAGAAVSLPIPNTGEFLTGDGAQILASLIKLIPDPTGQSGKYIGTDGDAIVWQAGPVIPDDGVASAANKITIGTNIIQFGTDTFPVPTVSPPHGSSKVVTFGTAFTTCGGVIVAPNKNIVASNGYIPICSAEYTAGGFTAIYNTNENDIYSGADVAVTVPFSWIAWGT